MKDVYSKEPWLLDHPMGSFFKKNEWYYFVTRTQLSKKKIGCGKKVKRKITRDDDSGSWRTNAKEDITDKETKKTIGVKQSLNFVRSNVNNKKQKREDGTSCDVSRDNESWIMTEYMLPEEKDKFHELLLSWSQPINIVDQEIFLAPILEQQPINIVDQEVFLSPFLEQTNIFDQEIFLSPFLKEQPTNIACNIQENNKDDHEALIPYHHHEFAADCYTEQQPINESHGHVPKIPLIGSEQEAEIEEIQELINSLATVNVSSLPMEEDDGILNYDAQFIYQDLLESVCYPPPPPPRNL
ncbi:unnamed protein product [Brassica oleracea]